MHFSKTYAQILLTLPPELRDNAISYRQLKKLINQVVEELSALGFTPDVLHDLLEQGNSALQQIQGSGNEDPVSLVVQPILDDSPFKIAYEVKGNVSHLEPRLRVSVIGQADPDRLAPLTTLLSGIQGISDNNIIPQELIIPLASDTAFFELLTNALESLSTHLNGVHAEFMSTLTSLSNSISQHARPLSASHEFHPYSQTSDPGTIAVSSASSFFRPGAKSDLYLWREFFQLYVEAEVFESVEERNRGERSIEEAEKRLLQFMDRVHESDIFHGSNLKRKDSQKDIDTFLHLTAFVLDLKKFHHANAEATRKILKKHSKRTALPVPVSLSQEMTAAVGSLRDDSSSVTLFPDGSISLPRLLVQAIGEVLLPIIPHVDDYACLICTSIAFKPIRLVCGHLFCVRCLVKMQKRGQDDCPMCRAKTVLTADKSNIDWALLNFVRDWFPVESREKLISNEREATKEQAEELGISEGCIIA